MQKSFKAIYYATKIKTNSNIVKNSSFYTNLFAPVLIIRSLTTLGLTKLLLQDMAKNGQNKTYQVTFSRTVRFQDQQKFSPCDSHTSHNKKIKPCKTCNAQLSHNLIKIIMISF